MSRCQFLAMAMCVAMLGGCASLPPSQPPNAPSSALPDPESTRWGRQFTAAAHAHAERSAYRIFSIGVDGFLMRMEMINAAERTLDLQYYIFRVFNPFRYRGHNALLRDSEFLLEHSRLDYRMHNKLLVADNSMALAGVQSELLIVSPYVIPSQDQWQLLKDRRAQGVRVRILTNM